MEEGTYVIVWRGDQEGIRCLRCGRTSWNANDVRERWCAGCSAFHEEPNP